MRPSSEMRADVCGLSRPSLPARASVTSRSTQRLLPRFSRGTRLLANGCDAVANRRARVDHDLADVQLRERGDMLRDRRRRCLDPVANQSSSLSRQRTAPFHLRPSVREFVSSQPDMHGLEKHIFYSPHLPTLARTAGGDRGDSTRLPRVACARRALAAEPSNTETQPKPTFYPS